MAASNKIKNVSCGDALIVIGNVGLKGTQILADRGKNQLLKRYNSHFIAEAAGCFAAENDTNEAIGMLFDLPYYLVGDGGIFRALWQFSTECKKGFEADIFDIPIKQHTIELCNFFDINPYEMISGKCILTSIKYPRKLLRKLWDFGYAANVIGEITDNNDKRVYHQGGSLCLRPSKINVLSEKIFLKGNGD